MVVDEPRIPGYLAHEELRPGQAEMITEAYDVLVNKGSHLACAPTGIGKTAAALSAALDASFSSNEKRTISFLSLQEFQCVLPFQGELIKPIHRLLFSAFLW